MYISFDGVLGICSGSLGRLDFAAGEASTRRVEAVLDDPGGNRGEGSGLSVGKGGGNGDIEMPVTEAEWA